MHIDVDMESDCLKNKVANLDKINNPQNKLYDNHSDDSTSNVDNPCEHKVPETGYMDNCGKEVGNLKVKMEINKNEFEVNDDTLQQFCPSQNIKIEKETTDMKTETDRNDSDVDREVKKHLKEAVDIRVPKVRNKKEISECKLIASSDNESKRKMSETPPLQKLMRQDFSPLQSNTSSPSLPKKFKDNFSSKEIFKGSSSKNGFTSKLASVIVPSVSLPTRAASHPKQLLSFSTAHLHSSSLKGSNISKSSCSPNSFVSKQIPLPCSLFQVPTVDEQPLDLSVSKKSTSNNSVHNSKLYKNSISDIKKKDNGLSSISLQSLQQRFGGDFHLRGLRKPLNYMLYDPEIPTLHQALFQSASLALPHFPLPASNGIPKMKQDQRHKSSTPSPQTVNNEDPSKSLKREESFSEKSIKREHSEKSESENNKVVVSGEDVQGENYTNHLCTCGKWFDGLYSLSLHLQETGHLPARNKSISLLEYPKLVRGQDMWLNQESEQTRRILRCIQCGESFKTLPMLTVHMMKTQHYTKIVSSEHTRRSHKCSTYCDKEQDKECVFKCKVCQNSFSDMEGLANHMIISGHHKNQSTRPPHSYNDLHFRKRKRYSFEESLNPYGNPNVAAMLHEYRKESISGQDSQDMLSDDLDDSKFGCENCGMRVEMKLFVTHVRSCLGQKLRDVSKMEKENIVKEEKLKNDNHRMKDELTKEINGITSPSKKRKVDHISIKGESKSETNDSVKLELKEDNIHTNADNNIGSNAESEKGNMKLSLNKPYQSDNDSDIDISKNILKEIQTLVESKHLNVLTSERKSGIVSEITNDCDSSSEREEKETRVSKKLDIIDPENVKEELDAGSALSAMESFIKKSFSNKFDYKKGNIIINPHADTTSHTKPLSSSITFDSTDYLNKYRNFYAALNLNNGFKQGSATSYNEKDGQKLRGYTVQRHKSEVVKCENDKSSSPFQEECKDDCSVKSNHSDSSSVLDGKRNIEKKYLNMEETEGSKSDNDKSSALDNLSSFVYGQTLTSEHPLDSLQRLITKSDIPKLMGSDCMRAFQYLPPYLQLHQSNSDLTVPLNLSVKSQHGDSDDEDSKSRLDDDTGSFSDCDTVTSPINSDGEPLEYHCAACSRRFASKGLYRYHLSRCHLSSVKRYGIKEAFNMSPYVYLPLDHTAKFSKYYEMAKELATKGKGNRTK